ncbi:putative carboxylesterase 17 [Vitis vinifera]|uniref:Putative carboxylesterase 17 n=1 Tax=Vitis vinifera TaxID=29760 RepID=A0A438F284_VITVI|nr:putative carboxylesterase 17 [Vitis vinifera]
MSMVAEEPGLIQIFSDGSVKRPERETSPASEDSSSTGYKSKDVIIDSTKPISGRIFVPDTPASSSLLPVLVYFHGGGFCIGTATWLGYHTFLGDFAVAAQSIVLSVDYRLAPEHRLPTAYDDCYCSLEWLSKQVSSEPWLQRADLSRVFLSGDSAGGNIAHNIAIRAIQKGCDEVKIKGVLPIHPYFGSEERIDKEKASESAKDAELSREEWGRFPAVVVYVAGLDFFKERGVMYAGFLEKRGVEVKLVEAEGEQHVYHMFHPKSEATRLLQKKMSEFIHSF